MKNQNEPMPLRDLPGYLQSARENGQDYSPVVDMGRIVAPASSLHPIRLAYASAVCLFLALGGFYFTATKNISIDSDMTPQAVADIVEEGGGKVFSVKQNDEGEYEVRVFTLRSMASLVEGLRRNKNIEKVEGK